jgi:UDP-glucose-4-epimerase GalE
MNIKSPPELRRQGSLEMPRNILVTGGAGYVGSHTCKTLHEYGFTPVTFDNLSTGHREFVKWGPLYEGDLLKQSDIEEVFDLYKIDCVMHFAAKAYVNESTLDPIKYYRENIQASVNLLETFIQHKGKAFVFSSSCATYGIPNLPYINENTSQNPINPYGFTKLAIEKLIIDLQKLHNFNYTILRYFNAAGADANLEIGESHLNETHVIPLLLRAAEVNGTFKIFGHDYDTPDGTAVRDYVHVNDIALGHLRSLEVMLEQKRNIICNLGTGIGISVLELVNQIKLWKSDFTIKFEPRRSGDPASLVAENKLSQEVLQIDYQNSNLAQILQTAIDWHKSKHFI